MVDPNGRLPAFLKTTSSYTTVDDGIPPSIIILIELMNIIEPYVCPVLTGITSSIVAQLDPSYYNYSLCKCSTGYYGRGNMCKACLEHGNCSSSDSTYMIIPNGYA